MSEIDKNRCLNSGNVELVSLFSESASSEFKTYLEELDNLKKKDNRRAYGITLLNLPFPSLKASELEMARFLESPIVASLCHTFSGVFAVDITSIKNAIDSERFKSFITYIKTNKSIYFVLYGYIKNREKISGVKKALKKANISYIEKEFDSEKEEKYVSNFGY